MRRRAYHSVIKRKTKSVARGKVRIYYISSKRIRRPKCSKKTFGLFFKIEARADIYYINVVKRSTFLGVAENYAILIFLSILEKCENLVSIAIKKHKR